MAVTVNSSPTRSAAVVKVRTAKPEDAAGMVAVMNPIIDVGIFTVLDSAITVEAEREFISNFPGRGVFNVAVADDGTIVALQFIEPYINYHAFDHVGCIHTYVALTHRRCGIGAQLFVSTFASAISRGYEKLITFVRADNPVALIAYQRQGFRVIGTACRHAKVRGVYIDEVMIEKLLSPAGS